MHDKQALLENIRWGIAIVCVMPLIIAFTPLILIMNLADWIVKKTENIC